VSEPRPHPANPREIDGLVLLIGQGRLADAEHRARELLAIHPDDGMLWKILSVALRRQRKDALPALRRTRDLMPQDAEAHCNLGAALYDQGRWAEALASFDTALELQPDYIDALVDAANCMRGLGRTREAISSYYRVLRLMPQHAEAQNNLGNAFLELGQYADAAGCYRLALQIKPDNAQVLCNLGNALRQLGHLDEAFSASRQAIALDPKLPAAHNNLGQILAAQGRRQEAVACYRQALMLNPNDVECLNNLGNVLRELGSRREAAALYARAIELDPLRAESHCNFGNALIDLRRLDEAEAAFRQALTLEPDEPLTHLSLATALRLKRRAADAEASCETALALDSNHAQALSLLGELRADRGRFSEAETLFQRAIAADPDFSFPYLSIATHRRMTTNDALWRKGVEASLAKPQPLANEISLRYALGKYFDDVGRYRDAFEHYVRANELTKRYGTAFDPAKLTRRVDTIIRGFDAAFVRHPMIEASDSELPIFIVGMPRSGTSLAEQILASHPAAYGAGELLFWNGAFAAYRKAQIENQSGADLIPGLAREYLRRLTALSPGARRTVDKMPTNFMFAGLIHAAIPKARIIHMQRHPVDTCLSIYFQNFFNIGPYANDLAHLAQFYQQYLRVTAHWRSVLPATTLLEIPYEALIEDQEGWTRRMLDFVGLPWDPACLEFHRTDRVVITSSKWQVRQKIYASSAGRWRNYREFLGPLERLIELPVHA
jgi:tetratricopeptide (TPR) repeat protein